MCHIIYVCCVKCTQVQREWAFLWADYHQLLQIDRLGGRIWWIMHLFLWYDEGNVLLKSKISSGCWYLNVLIKLICLIIYQLTVPKLKECLRDWCCWFWECWRRWWWRLSVFAPKKSIEFIWILYQMGDMRELFASDSTWNASDSTAVAMIHQ